VATYINSGNALVVSQKDREAVRGEVAAICKAEFGFDKDIHVVTRDEWVEMIRNNPFPEAVDVPKFLHAAVLAGDPPQGAVEKLRAIATDGERIAVVDRVAYLHTPNGFGRSKLAEKFDKGIGVANTARNWNTVVKLMEMADAAAAG
jgi:uncharacterized protein (DUF1697 family)